MSETRSIRIASGQGFWGDDLEAPVRQVDGGPIDYLVLDYLAEVTMSIMQKQRARDPGAGYARDFVTLMERILKVLKGTPKRPGRSCAYKNGPRESSLTSTYRTASRGASAISITIAKRRWTSSHALKMVVG